VIGVDEISIQTGYTYRIVGSYLPRWRPIWFQGNDRSEASMDEVFQSLGPKKSRTIRLVVMDLWKAYLNPTLKPDHAPQVRTLFDKFHSTSCGPMRLRVIAGLTGPVRSGRITARCSRLSFALWGRPARLTKSENGFGASYPHVRPESYDNGCR